MEDTLYRGFVVVGSGERAPHQELVDGARSGVRVATDQIHVETFKLERREGSAADHARLEVGDVLRQTCLDAVEVGVFYRAGPNSIGRDGDLTGGIALYV